MPAGLLVEHVAAVVDIDLVGAERQAILDYLGLDEDAEVLLAPEPFIDLCALALSFPTALLRSNA